MLKLYLLLAAFHMLAVVVTGILWTILTLRPTPGLKKEFRDIRAVLEVVEPADFLDDIEPAEVGEMPRLRDAVEVVGYPVGGEEISITEGVVSRIEVQRYSHSQRHLLAVTVDAAPFTELK